MTSPTYPPRKETSGTVMKKIIMKGATGIPTVCPEG